MNLENFTSSNGIKTLLIDSPSSNVVTVQFWFKAGSSLETGQDQGIAHFLEHMFFKGSKKYPSMKIAKTIESYGAEINAFTSFDYTCYYINSPFHKGKKSLDVLLDMVCNPQFLEEDLIPERNVVMEEYLRSIDNPSQFNFMKIQESCFQKGYKHPILGKPATIKKFNLKQLKSFRSKYYNDKNALLIVAGNLKSISSYKKVINEFKLPKGPKSQFSRFMLQGKPQTNIHQKPTNQATLTFAIEAPDFNDKEAAVEDLALNTLTFGDMSPLYKYFVEESSLANGASGSTMFFAKGGTHFLRLSCPPENINKILSNFPREISKALANGFNQDDLDRIRNQYLASKVYEKESIESFAFALGHGFAQNGDIHSDDHYISSMNNVHLDELAPALYRILSRPIHATIQVPEDFKTKALDKNLNKCIDGLGALANKHNPKKIYKTLKSKHDESTIQMKVADNIEFIHRHNPLSETFALHCYLKGGLTEETNKNNGVYNMLAKCLTYGYEGIDYDDLKKDLEKKASYMNGFSGRNAYGMTFQGLSKYTTSLFDHFFKTLTNPSFPEDKFLLEKELIQRTLHIQKEDPIKQCFQNFSKLVFNQHPYSQEIIGTEKTVSNISLDDLRSLHHKNLKNKKVVITYCGNLPFENVLSKLEEYIKPKKLTKTSKSAVKRIKPLHNKFVHIPFEREQTHLMIGKPAFKNNTKEDSYLKLFTTLLSGQSSDLFLEVRDKKGLCYSVQPLHNSSMEAGYWGIYMGTSAEKYEQATEALMEIIRKFQKNGLSKKEFNTVKDMIYGQNLINIQTNDDYAYFYSIPVLHNLGLNYGYQSLDKLQQIKREDLNKFLAKYLDGGWNTVKVGKD